MEQNQTRPILHKSYKSVLGGWLLSAITAVILFGYAGIFNNQSMHGKILSILSLTLSAGGTFFCSLPLKISAQSLDKKVLSILGILTGVFLFICAAFVVGNQYISVPISLF